MKNNKAILLIVSLFFSTFWVNISIAGYCPSTPSTPYNLPLTSIVVPTNLPVGAEIPGSEKTVTFSGTCNSSTTTSNPTAGEPIITCYYGTGGEIGNLPGVYNTGVQGIGISIKNGNGQKVTGAGVRCDTRGTPLGYLNSDKSFSYRVSLVLVKTATNVGTGILNQSQTIFGMGVYSKDAIGSTNNTISYSGDINFKPVTCNVPSQMTVFLGDIPTSKFTSVGSVSDSQQLSIPVTCDTAVNVNTTITGNNYALTSQGVIALNDILGSARGVGVQMLYQGSPVNFGNTFSVGRVYTSNSTLNVPFTFRYYQTESTVTSGIANAVATLVFQYN